MFTDALSAGLIAVALTVAISYAISIRRYPYTTCRHCTGSGIDTSLAWPAHRPCKHCSGSGQILRRGARHRRLRGR